jgi:hypothetical protein
MAIPASASDSAGESFTPSPIIMTFLPFSCSLFMKFALSSGRTPAWNSSTPTLAATAYMITLYKNNSICATDKSSVNLK